MLFSLALTPLDFFSKISFHPIPLVVIVALALWYRHRVRGLAARGRTWPPLRSASWALALLILAASTLSGLDAYVQTSFSVHAVQLLGVFMLAPVFACLAAPLTLAIEGSAPDRGARLRSRLQGGIGTVVYNPALTWALFAGSLFVLFFSGQYRLSIEHGWFLQLTNLELLIVGCLWIWPVIGVDPKPRRLQIGWRMLYVLVCTVYYSVLGLAMESQRTRIAPSLTVSDLHTGGGVLWSTGELLTISMTIGILLQWLAADEGHALRSDRGHAEEDAHQLALWRADRRAAGLADVRARESVIARSRPAGTDASDASAGSARRASARLRPGSNSSDGQEPTGWQDAPDWQEPTDWQDAPDWPHKDVWPHKDDWPHPDDWPDPDDRPADRN
jgi:putative membrane protein